MAARKREEPPPPAVAPAAPSRAELLASELQRVKALKRLIAARKSRDSLLDFTRFTMPHPEDMDDVDRTLFETNWHHEAICQVLEEVEKGTKLRVIITMPPRHGKSELCSRRFPAWFEGRDPYRQIIFATYGADFAEDFGRNAREVIQMPAYRQVFPAVSLKKTSKAADRMETEAGGMMVWTGIGGPATGRGADCLVGETLVATDRGPVRLSALHQAETLPRVLSWDHRDQRFRYNRILATRKIEDRNVHRLVTESGREIVGTSNHRLYSATRGYIRLEDFAPGEKVALAEEQGAERLSALHARVSVFDVPEGIRESERGGAKGGPQGTRGPLLRGAVRAQASRHEEQSAMRGMRDPASEVITHRAPNRPHFLRGVPSLRQAGVALAKAGMSGVRDMVLAAVRAAAVLFQGVRGQGALSADGGQRQLALSRRNVVLGMVPSHAADHHGAGQIHVRGLRSARADDGRGIAQQSSCASHRRESGQQPRGQLGGALLFLPRDSSQVVYESVRLVEPVRGEKVSVYDLQVERDCNFFANEILVHNCLIIDDPIKDREQAESFAHRNKVWDWFTSVAYTRLMPNGRVVIILTRWHEDDIVGRIFNPDYVDPEESKKWYVLDLPAIINDGKTDPSLPEAERERALWPKRYPLEVLKSTRAFVGERDFTSLYQQRPSPPEGAFFQRESLFTYEESELPKNARVYMTGDLALTEDKKNDETCNGVWLLDEHDTLFLSPDIVWDRKTADRMIEKIIDQIERSGPQAMWWEKGQIDRAVGPFLKKRMMERGVYSWLQALPLNGNKGQRAISIRGRMAQGKVRFPRFAPWWPRAKDQLLKFTGSGDDAEDDFVDMCSIAGQALGKQMRGTAEVKREGNVLTVGSLAWIKKDSDFRKSEEERMKKQGGF